jgi:DNA-binding transcriptional MerR regulator
MSDELYTLEQLSERVADLLAEDYGGQKSGRVRELPNGRTIRWYTTIGLVDRPLATRGRVALYGTRHVLQLAAIKKLQADGLTLAEVQERLLGASNVELALLAKVDPANERPRYPVDVVYHSAGVEAEFDEMLRTADGDTVTNTVGNVVPAFRVGDSVTVLLNGVSRHLDDADIAELTAAATPLLDAIERLGLTPRKERR